MNRKRGKYKKSGKYSKYGLIPLFTLIAIFSLSGTLALESISQRAFNATYEEVPYLEVEVEKRVEGDVHTILPGAEFTLWNVDAEPETQVLVDANQNPIGPTFITDENGRFGFTLHPGNYCLVEEHIPTGFGLIDDNNRTCFSIAQDGDGELVLIMDETEVDYVAVYNRRLHGDLIVDKIVVNEDGDELTGVQQNQLFTFNIDFTYNDANFPGPHDYVVYQLLFNTAGEVTGQGPQLRTGSVNSNGTFQLRHGERAVFYHIPTGVVYEVSEIVPEGFDLVANGTSGVIEYQGTNEEPVNHAVFTNIIQEEGPGPDDGYLVVEKYVIGDLDPADREFQFTVIIGGEEFTFTLGHGDYWASERFPIGTPFEVVEDDYSEYGIISSPNQVTGQILTGRNVVPFTNHVDPDDDGEGDLIVSKRVVGEDYDPDQIFSFTLTLKDIPLCLPNGEIDMEEAEDACEDVIIYVGGVPHIITTSEWTYDFELMADESLDFRNIPAGVGFTVIEHETAGFIQGIISYEGEIISDFEIDARFTNEYQPGIGPDPTGSLEVCKILTDLSNAPQTYFYFELWINDELFEEFTLHANDCYLFENLPLGAQFRVREPLDLIPTGYVFVTSVGELGTIREEGRAVFINGRDYIYIPVEKQWEIHPDLTGVNQPNYIIVYLLANGTRVQVATITADGNWQYEFRARRYDANGELIVYTVEEAPISGWVETVTVDGDGFIILNAAIIPEIRDGIEIEKVLIGDPEEDPVFYFNMIPIRNAPAPVPNRVSVTRDGTVSFGNITFTEPGVFEYIVREEIPADQGDFNFDVSTFRVVFTVTASADGSLTVNPPVITLEDAPVSNIVFTNHYEPCEECEECEECGM